MVISLSPLAGTLVGLALPQAGPVAATMALSFPIAGSAAVSSALLRRQLRFRAIAIVDVLSYLVEYNCIVGVAGIKRCWTIRARRRGLGAGSPPVGERLS